MKSPYDIIIRPVLTEKSYDAMNGKKYAFEVAIDAGKTEIKMAVETIFGVKVASVNTLRLEGKLVQPWVQELLEAWTALVQRLPEGREVRGILDAVSFVDECGRSALCMMGRKGCAFRASGPFMAAVIEDVKERVADVR